LRIRSVRRLGLDIDLPGAAEIIEVIDEKATHICLNGLIDIADGDTLLSTLSSSTLMYCSGTLGIKVELIMPISGRLRAATRNLVKLSERNFTSFPARSSRTN